MGHFPQSKERVTQGDPLAMIAYGLGTPPLSGTSVYPTPVLISHDMLMTLWQTEISQTSDNI